MKGLSVRKKIALLSLSTIFAVSLVSAGAAQASSITGTITEFDPVHLCRTAPDVLTYKIEMQVKFVAIGVSKPKTVRMGYQVMNADTKAVLRSGVLNLKKKKGYKGRSSTISATAGTNIKYHVTGKFRSGGKDVKTKFTSYDSIPSVEAMDAAGVPNC
jgi:hypothetical protein